MAETYSECPNCGFEDPDDEEFGLYDNGTGVAKCLNCTWEEPESDEEDE